MADTNHTLDEGVTGVISKIQLPNGGVYEIHDAKAIHSVAELGLSQALVFKGTVASVDELPTSAKPGDFYIVTTEGGNVEYVRTDNNAWEMLGPAHDYATSTHTHKVTVTGTNAASTVTGNVTVPTVGSSSKYVKATVSRGNATTDTALGTSATFTTTVTPTTTNIKATASGATVGANGTTPVITGLSEPTKDSALGADTTFAVSGGAATTSKMVTTTVKNPSVTAVSIPNVTGNTKVTIPNVTSVGSRTAGKAASWGAEVTDGLLTFTWTTNTPTVVTMPTLGNPLTATNTTLGTAISASQVSTTNVTVATGALASNGTGSAVATGVSAITVTANDDDLVDAVTGITPSGTATALTGVKVTKQPTVALATGATAGTGVISVATGISSASTEATNKDTVTAITAIPGPTVTLSKDGTSTDGISLVESVTVGSTTASITNGSAAAQKWTQKTGSTGTPQ